jgi:hypothetical protein
MPNDDAMTLRTASIHKNAVCLTASGRAKMKAKFRLFSLLLCATAAMP